MCEITRQKPLLKVCWNKLNGKKYVLLYNDLIDAIDPNSVTCGDHLVLITDGSANCVFRLVDFNKEFTFEQPNV